MDVADPKVGCLGRFWIKAVRLPGIEPGFRAYKARALPISDRRVSTP